MRIPAESHLCCSNAHATPHDTLTRRRLLGVAAGAAGAAVLSRFWLPTLAHAAPMAGPKPIPGGITVPFAKGLFHIFLPEPGKEPSTISDFDGVVGLSVVRGMCTRTRMGGGAPERLLYETDMRFHDGSLCGSRWQDRDWVLRLCLTRCLRGSGRPFAPAARHQSRHHLRWPLLDDPASTRERPGQPAGGIGHHAHGPGAHARPAEPHQCAE